MKFRLKQTQELIKILSKNTQEQFEDIILNFFKFLFAFINE